MNATTMRRCSSTSLLRSIALLATTTLLLFGRTTDVDNNSSLISLPWPCLFASASSITHRITSNYHQANINSATLRLQRDVIRHSEQRRSLYNYNNNGAYDQYVNQGAQNYAEGDDAAYADAQKAMQDQDRTSNSSIFNFMQLFDSKFLPRLRHCVQFLRRWAYTIFLLIL